MNRFQKLVLGSFIIVALLIGAFPPWQYAAGGMHKNIGFHFLLAPPSLPLTRTETNLVPDETKPDAGPAKKGETFSDFLKRSMGNEKAITTTTVIGRLEAHIDMTQLTVEWVTLILVSSALLLLLRKPRSL